MLLLLLLILIVFVENNFVVKLLYEFGMMTGWFGRYSFRCEPVDYSGSALALRVC